MPARCTPSPRPFRRKAVAAASALALGLLGTLAVATPSSAKSKVPVKLDGQVNNKGKGTIKGGEVAIEADNFYFAKTFLKGSAGDVTVEIANEGSAPHTFTIDDQDIDEEIAPGDTTTVTVTLTAGKPVNFYCTLHVSQGMQGAFYTGAGGKATSSGTKDNGSGGSSGSGGSGGIPGY
jgi:plastocyanin